MNKVLVIAPHPDDETLGCGGTLLKHLHRGDEINWLIFTAINEDNYSPEQVNTRTAEISEVAKAYNFKAVEQLRYPTTKLDTIPLSDMIGKTSEIIKKVEPEIIYLPYPGDVHSDHRIVFEVISACTKQFRYPWIRRILAYQTLSETEFNINPIIQGFRPNVFIDISNYLEGKISIMQLYASELGQHPFPRSEQNIKSIANFRGATANCKAAEAFMLLKEID